VLLMDEPTVGLDPASRTSLLATVTELRRSDGVAVLWATHLCEEVAGADRIIVMHRGKLLANASPAELMREAAAETVEAAFLKMTGVGSRSAA